MPTKRHSQGSRKGAADRGRGALIYDALIVACAALAVTFFVVAVRWTG